MSKFEQPPTPEEMEPEKEEDRGQEADLGEKVEAPSEQLPTEQEEVVSEKEISPEVQEKAEEFDKELSQGIEKALKAEVLTPEQANLILDWAKELKPEDKAELMEEMEKAFEEEEKLTPEKREKEEKTPEDLQELLKQYEETIDNLAERAKAVGIEVSAEELKNVLEMFRKIESKEGEEMDWKGYLDNQFKELSDRIEKLEKDKKEGKPASEKEQKKTKEDFTKFFEDMVAKLTEYVIKLIIRTFTGLARGIAGAFKREKE